MHNPLRSSLTWAGRSNLWMSLNINLQVQTLQRSINLIPLYVGLWGLSAREKAQAAVSRLSPEPCVKDHPQTESADRAG